MASTSSARTSSSSSFTTLFKHDVFLSFYGKDTRNSFTDHLYTALKEKGIDAFRDDEKLERGTFIAPELMKAIEESKFAVVVLSENYASSRWCLDELVKIVVCMEETGLTILPIFYHVDPSDVRQQTGTYAAAFAEHEKNSKVNTEKIQTWKEALKRVGNIAGWDVKDRPESKVIQETIGRIRSQLNRKIVTVRKDLVAMNSRKKEMIKCFDLGLDNVRFIGIWGMGGVGKTTLVKVMYNTVYSQFEASSFIGHVSEKARNPGLVSLQKQLLYEILMEKKLKRFDVDEGTDWLQKRLQKIKVLIVLDDVDEDKQLEALAGSHDWFGLGSRIIITSRDKQLLKRKVDYIYEVKKLDHDDALELFSQRAFKKPYPKKDYVDLSNKFVMYAKGLPLALEVLGSSLFDRTRKAWEDALDDLKENPNKEIMDILVVGYQKLKPTTQNLFLDIACFFKGEDKDRVADLYKGLCYNMDVAILEDRSLITILGKKLWMHDLLQEMGRDIVCREAPQEPGRRSRLWHYKDTFSVLRNNTGTKSVEGMVLNSYQPTEDLNVHTTFSGMERLRLIRIITNVHLPRGLNYLSNELRLMEWHKYPLKYMPRSFEPKNLVELIMPCSCIKQLPEGFGNLENLKLMDFSDSQYIIKTPNFKGFPNIERLIFQGCTRLYVVHSSIGALKHLTLLNLKDCKSLNSFPHEINLESLSFLILSGCSRFKKFPEVGSNMTRLSNLYLNGTAIEELPLSIKHLTGLTLLNLRECKNLSKCPSIVCSLTSLTALNLSGCKGQAPKFMHLFGLCFCAEFVSWGYGFFIDHHLGEEPFNMLVPKSFSGLSSLLSLDLSDCNLSDTAFPKDLSCLSSLQYLDLSKNNFTCLPHSFSQISQLKFLYLDHCTRLQSLANLPLSTEIVMARECTSLEKFSNQVVIWTAGETTFTFINCLSWDEDEKCRTSDFSLVGKHFREAEDEEFRNSGIPLVDIRSQRLWQIYMMERIYQSNVFYLISPQTEIPEWFNFQSPKSSVKILLTSDTCNDSTSKGIAICAIFVVDKNLIDASSCEDSEYFHEFICHFDMDGGPVDCPIVLNIPKDKYSIGSFGVVIYISYSRFGDYLEKCSYISSSITTNSPSIKIRKCGGRILSEKDMEEVLQNSNAQSPTLRSAPSRLNKGTEAVQGIVLESDVPKNVDWNPEAFSKMRNLKLLKICNVQLMHDLKHLPTSLRILDWRWYPSKLLTSISQSKIFENLKVMNLSESLKLIEAPDIIEVPNLKSLVLKDCINLRRIHPSIGIHKKLTFLDLRGCKNLTSLPSKFEIECLTNLNLTGCSKLTEIPAFGRNMKRVRSLYLGYTAITTLPTSIEHLTDLEELDLQDTAIREVPSSIGLLKHLHSLTLSECKGLSMPTSPHPIDLLFSSLSLSPASSLTHLLLGDCNLKAIPNDIGSLVSLEWLVLDGNDFDCLPESIIQLSKLKWMHLNNCTSLRSLPKLPLNIELVEAKGCISLEMLPDPLKPSDSLEPSLNLENCDKLADNQSCIDWFISGIKKFLKLSPSLPLSVLKESYNIVFPGSEIPEWFSYQNIGKEVKIKVPSHLCKNVGIVICVVCPTLDYSLIANGKEISFESGTVVQVSSDHLRLVYVTPQFFDEESNKLSWEGDVNGFSQIRIKIETHYSSVKVKKWGFHMIYKKDIEDLDMDVLHHNFDSLSVEVERSSDYNMAGPSGEGSSDCEESSGYEGCDWE